MVFSFATALYVLASAFALGITLWALGTSLLGRDLGFFHRLLGLLAALLLPAAAVVYGLGGELGIPHATWALAALPLLGIAATWCNMLTVARQGAGWQVVHFPVLVFNALLVGVYTCRALQELVGLDLGTPAAALTHAHAVVQTLVGHPAALDQPVWLHLPIVLPLAFTFHLGHKTATATCSLFALAFTALYVMAMPYAFERVNGYRADPGDLPPATSIRDVGVSVPWASRRLSEESLRDWRQALLDLGATHVAVPAEPGLFSDDALLHQVRDEVAWAREQGLAIVACAMPPPDRLLRPATTVGALASDMAQLHWLLAEKLEPELLVLFSGPFDDLLPYTAGGGTLQQWMDVIRRSAADVGRANDKVKVAVALASRAPHAEELFRMLVADDSPVQAVGLIFTPGTHDAIDLDTDLANAQRWCQRIPGSRPVRILPVRGGIHQCGGELGQWRFLLRVLAGLEGTGRVRSATVDGLVDLGHSHGLVSVEGRRRLAWFGLKDRLSEPVAGAPR